MHDQTVLPLTVHACKGVLLAMSVFACMRSFCVLLFQCRPATNDAVIAAKDSQIASLQAALMEKDRILQNMSRVRAGFTINFTNSCKIL